MSRAARATVGILYSGELGSVLGRLLKQGGLDVITTLEGRSARTAQLAQQAGLDVLPTLEDVIARADILLSTVCPASAVALAEAYRARRPATAPPQIYVDVNSISPETAQHIEQIVGLPGVTFVDGAVHGLASGLPLTGTLYLSGPAALTVADLFGRYLRVRALGDEPGRASAFKMMISGLAKGVVALFAEMSRAAHRAGLLDELLVCYRNAYPEIMALVDRMLPTYPQHAARRCDELGEVERTLEALQLEPCMVHSARRITAELAGLHTEARPAHAWSVAEVIDAFARAGDPLVLTPERVAGAGAQMLSHAMLSAPSGSPH
jgi:3-hydroxyisobutyrate dehydrogenase-like beta-hydroxyacid dehydrogenase